MLCLLTLLVQGAGQGWAYDQRVTESSRRLRDTWEPELFDPQTITLTNMPLLPTVLQPLSPHLLLRLEHQICLPFGHRMKPARLRFRTRAAMLRLCLRIARSAHNL